MKKQLRYLNAGLYKLGKTYHDGLPIKEIADLLEANGFDRTAIDGIYTGHQGHDSVQIMRTETWAYYLHLNWYRMPSGRYEIVAYAN